MKYYTFYLDENIVEQIREEAIAEAKSECANTNRELSKKIRKILSAHLKTKTKN